MEVLESDYIKKIFNYYKFTKDEIEEFSSISMPIIIHDEFQKRLSSEFVHHDEVSLGIHILTDAIITYKLSKSKSNKKDFNIEDAVLIALFHDLYTNPWQNSGVKKSRGINRHGFVHPIEAALNAVRWYPSYFNENEERTVKLLDGIIHHMFPFPVRKIDGTNMELNNSHLLDNPKYLKIITELTKSAIPGLSFRRSKNIEGIIMNKADKISSLSELKNFNAFLTLITGNNKNLTLKKH